MIFSTKLHNQFTLKASFNKKVKKIINRLFNIKKARLSPCFYHLLKINHAIPLQRYLCDKLCGAAGVAKLVVIPRHNFNEVAIG